MSLRVAENIEHQHKRSTCNGFSNNSTETSRNRHSRRVMDDNLTVKSIFLRTPLPQDNESNSLKKWLPMKMTEEEVSFTELSAHKNEECCVASSYFAVIKDSSHISSSPLLIHSLPSRHFMNHSNRFFSNDIKSRRSLNGLCSSCTSSSDQSEPMPCFRKIRLPRLHLTHSSMSSPTSLNYGSVQTSDPLDVTECSSKARNRLPTLPLPHYQSPILSIPNATLKRKGSIQPFIDVPSTSPATEKHRGGRITHRKKLEKQTPLSSLNEVPFSKDDKDEKESISIQIQSIPTVQTVITSVESKDVPSSSQNLPLETTQVVAIVNEEFPYADPLSSNGSPAFQDRLNEIALFELVTTRQEQGRPWRRKKVKRNLDF